MAKEERRPGKRGETHYSGGSKPSFKREGGERKPFRKEGGDDGKPYRGRPQRQEDGDRKPYNREGGGDKPFDDRKPFRKRAEDDKPSGGRKPFHKREDGNKSFGDRKPFKKRDEGDKPYSERKPLRRREEGDKPFEDRKLFQKREGDDKPYSDRKPFRKNAEGNHEAGEKKVWRKDDQRPAARNDERRAGGFRKEGSDLPPFRRKEDDGGYNTDKKPFHKRDEKGVGEKPFRRERSDEKPAFRKRDEGQGHPPKRSADRSYKKRSSEASLFDKKPKESGFQKEAFDEWSNPAKPGRRDEAARNDGPMTLNKYLAHSGISSRRDAAAIIKEGKVAVNGTVLDEPGYRVQPGDKIVFDGKELRPQRHFVYVLLNKPKDFITTTEDERGRRTVMELVTGATTDRLYPIGRLDRNTTGVLLLTNDGDLAQKLSHPKYESKKIYQASLDKELTHRHFDQITEGVELEDGLAKVDHLAYLDTKSEIGLEIHSGRNRIVRRIFESLGYDVVRLDRVMYAGLTKKNVSRGKWRFLTEQEVVRLKHFKL